MLRLVNCACHIFNFYCRYLKCPSVYDRLLLKTGKFYDYKKYTYVPHIHLYFKWPVNHHNRKELLIYH